VLHAQLPSDSGPSQQLANRLATDAARVWGADRARELTQAIRDTSETLARVVAVSLTTEDAEPDFIR
jgi:hypothetical protein